jgi:hypothetical protein
MIASLKAVVPHSFWDAIRVADLIATVANLAGWTVLRWYPRPAAAVLAHRGKAFRYGGAGASDPTCSTLFCKWRETCCRPL